MPTTCFLFGVTAPFSHSEARKKLPMCGEQAVPNVKRRGLLDVISTSWSWVNPKAAIYGTRTTCPQRQALCETEAAKKPLVHASPASEYSTASSSTKTLPRDNESSKHVCPDCPVVLRMSAAIPDETFTKQSNPLQRPWLPGYKQRVAAKENPARVPSTTEAREQRGRSK